MVSERKPVLTLPPKRYRPRKPVLALPAGSGLEEAFAREWQQFMRAQNSKRDGKFPLMPPLREMSFEAGRKWRFDFSWPERKVAVEIDGGVGPRLRGRHVRPKGFEADCEKLNVALLAGWRVYRITAKMLRERPVQCCEDVERLLRQALDDGARRIVVDLRGLSFMDSTGITLLTRWNNASARDGFDLALVQGHERIARLFTLTGLDEYFTFVAG